MPEVIKNNKELLFVNNELVEQGKTVAAFGTSTGATTFSFNYDLGQPCIAYPSTSFENDL